MKNLKTLFFALTWVLLFFGSGNAWGQTADVFYEQCTAVSDIANNGTYIIVISNGTNYYAVQQNSTNAVGITPETDGKIKNPSSSIIWTAESTSTANGFTFKSGTKYIYYSGSKTTLSAAGSNGSIWVVSKLTTGTNTFELNYNATNGRFIGWGGSDFKAYATSNFINQFAKDASFGQYSGALFIYKPASTKTAV